MIEHYLAGQTKAVLVNATVSGTLVLISLLLFPLKEKVSRTFECEASLTERQPAEFPLWFQGFEELKMVLVYVVAQGTIIMVGYHPHPARRSIAALLSFGYLFATFTLDFVSPLLQRHRMRYSRIAKWMALHPIVLWGFGGLVALPALAGNLYLAKHKAVAFDDAILIGFAANLVSIVVAIVAGTALASKVLDPLQQSDRPGTVARTIGWLVVLSALMANGYVYGNVALSVHHKSQILKCKYALVPGTFSVQRPSWRQVFRGKVGIGVTFDLEITNPTDVDVVLESSRLELRHENALVTTSRIAPLSVAAKGRQRQRVKLALSVSPLVLRKWKTLLDDRWSLTLYVQLTDSLELPIYLRHPFGAKK